jgi:hypothetical protein
MSDCIFLKNGLTILPDVRKPVLRKASGFFAPKISLRLKLFPIAGRIGCAMAGWAPMLVMAKVRGIVLNWTEWERHL